MTGLVEKFSSLIGNPTMDTGHAADGFLAIL